MMDIMNVTCAEIRTEDGFEFRVSSDRFTQFSEFECEQLWYSKDDRLMADPSNPHRLIDPVISASSDRLVTSYCVDELRHEIYCYTSGVNDFSLNITITCFQMEMIMLSPVERKGMR
ncbi:hypothetical protein ABG768_020655 [Culter alburnus]|uniref:Uncharacterized protein n=1 Tax=Culter alburnus TaxID=194366 RepID=A0AAW2B267_CULAL